MLPYTAMSPKPKFLKRSSFRGVSFAQTAPIANKGGFVPLKFGLVVGQKDGVTALAVKGYRFGLFGREHVGRVNDVGVNAG